MRLAIFLLAVSLVSCTTHNDEPEPVDIPYFFVGTINSQTIGFAGGAPQVPFYNNLVYSHVEQPAADSFHVYEGTSIYSQSPGTLSGARVSIMGIFDHLPDAEGRKEMFFSGYHPFASTAGEGRAGAIVDFTDGNGMQWSTLNHPQSDTAFRMEMISPLTDTAATAVFQATFSCRLFNSAGDSMNLQNGSVRGKILKR